MKALKLLSIFMMLFAFASCGDDDKDEPGAGGDVVGNWRYTEYFDDEDGYWSLEFHFYKDHTFECWESGTYEHGYSTGKWETKNGMITISFKDGDGYDDETYRYEVKGNKLIIYDYEEEGPNVFVKV